MALADEENVPPSSSQDFPASSPLLPSSASNGRPKLKKAPPITPRRFNRFFSPRTSRSDSGAARQLRELTASAVNRRSVKAGFEDLSSCPPSKRRRLSSQSHRTISDLPSSPPYSSPLRRTYEAASQDGDDTESISEEDFPKPVVRSRVWQHFTASPTFIRCPSVQNATADFCSGPEDVYEYEPDRPVPFCMSPCNTNSLVATGDEDGFVRILETNGSRPLGSPIVKFSAHGNAILDMAFSHDDRFLATAGGDQVGRVIDMPTQSTVNVLQGHNSSLKQIMFRPDDVNVLVTCARDGLVAFWDVRCKTTDPSLTLSIPFNKDAGPSQPNRSASRPSMINWIPPVPMPSMRPVQKLSSNTTSPASPRLESVTSLLFLPSSPHHLVTSSDCHAQLRLWDIRGKYHTRSRRGQEVSSRAVSLTDPLAHHVNHRHYGITSLSLSSDASRIYATCKDNRVYVHATSHLYLGQTPSSARTTGLTGLGPLYALEHPRLSIGSFYVRSAVRSSTTTSAHEELLAVGGTYGPTIIPTNERRLSHQPHLTDSARFDTQPDFPVYSLSTTLEEGHEREVTGVCWTSEGRLMSIGDDSLTRRWTEDRETARRVRSGEAGMGTWAVAAAEGWDDDEG